MTSPLPYLFLQNIRTIVLLVFFLCGIPSHPIQAQDTLRMGFWNVENLFDTQHDTLKEDIAFTPSGDNHWTKRRYTDKCNKIYKVIAAMQWPALLGLAEVENDHVLRDLCLATPLRKMHYQFVHFDSPDRRGVDCALLYRSDLLQIIDSYPINVSDSTKAFFTRDILFVSCRHTASDDTCYIFVNHWPSKRGAGIAEQRRIEIAHILLSAMDSLQKAHPTSLIMAMGDFNSSPIEEAIDKGLQFYGHKTNPYGFHNLMRQIPLGTGSYKYQDTWSCIDQIIANRELKVSIFSPDFMLLNDNKYLGKKPFRTYTAMKYWGGYSDHLPIFISLP